MTIKRKAADSPMVLRTKDGAITPVHDNRTDHLPGYSPETVRGYRDVEGGFWVASTKPEADFEAITGSLPTHKHPHRRALQRRNLTAGRAPRHELGPTPRPAGRARSVTGDRSGPGGRRERRTRQPPREGPRWRHGCSLSLSWAAVAA